MVSPVLTQDPEALYSSPNTGGRQLKEEAHYENADLYENMPPPKLANRYPPKPSSSSSTSSSSASNRHYKTPVSKVSSKFLTSDAKAKDAAQVTNTLHINLLCCFLCFSSANMEFSIFCICLFVTRSD